MEEKIPDTVKYTIADKPPPIPDQVSGLTGSEPYYIDKLSSTLKW